MDNERQPQSEDEQDIEGQIYKIGRRDETPDPADQAGKGEVAHDEDADDDAEGHGIRGHI